MVDKSRAQEILQKLQRMYPEAKMILEYTNTFELLVAVMLSAQCTDVMVNKVTAKLFPKYKTQYKAFKDKYMEYEKKVSIPKEELVEIVNVAFMPREELEQDIKSTGFYKSKAQRLQEAARMILDRFHGEVPKTMAELLLLRGVARKTANVILGNAYKVSEGIAVDTHVKRVAKRLGLTNHTDPDKIEKDLMTLFDKKDWYKLTYLLIEHGRRVCTARKTDCDNCV
jgi:endonuclease III